MKKYILLTGVAIAMIALNSVMAQQRLNGSVAKSFEEKFPGARVSSWKILDKNIHKAQFTRQGQGWLAFFDEHGQLITSGRRIKETDHLPLTVQQAFATKKQRLEKKFGNLTVAYIYEMVSSDGTKYYSTLDNQNIQLTISMKSDGSTVVERKEMKAPPVSSPTRDIIAKKD